MKKLVLNELESSLLKKFNVVDVIRGDFEIHIEKNYDFNENEEEDYILNPRYLIYIMNAYDKVVVK